MGVANMGAKCSCRTGEGDWCSTGAKEPSGARSCIRSARSPVAIKPCPANAWWEKSQQGNNTEIHLSVWLTSYLLFARVDRNYQADMGFPSYCQWGLEMLHLSDKETLLRTGPMAQPDPRMHKTDQLDTLGTQLQTKIDSTDLSPDSKTSYTSGEIHSTRTTDAWALLQVSVSLE